MPSTLEDIVERYGEGIETLYKAYAPFIEADNGIGYKGVILHDTNTDKVMCDLCGEWFNSLSRHITSTHNKDVKSYKVERGLGITTPLCTKTVSQTFRSAAIKTQSEKPGNMVSIRRKREYRNPTYLENMKLGKNTMIHRNRFGLCPDQMALRYIVIALDNGKFPNEGLIFNYDLVLWRNISRLYGNFPSFYKDIGLDPRESNYELTDDHIKRFGEKLVVTAMLAKKQKHKDSPLKESDLNKKEKDMVFGVFGSWNKAKKAVGLDQLLAEAK